jgi:transcriptional regulator with GAF, ATPase, and Fis domain
MKERIEQKIRELSIGDKPLELSGETLRKLSGIGVYVFYWGASALYVGKGKNALHRFATKTHQHASKAISECDRLCVYLCGSQAQATELETLLIAWLKPKYNKNGIALDVALLLGGYNSEEKNEEELSFDAHVGDLESKLLRESLTKAHGNRIAAARQLKMSYRSFRHFAKKHNI